MTRRGYSRRRRVVCRRLAPNVPYAPTEEICRKKADSFALKTMISVVLITVYKFRFMGHMKTAILLNDELFLLLKIKREKLDIRAVYSIEEKKGVT